MNKLETKERIQVVAAIIVALVFVAASIFNYQRRPSPQAVRLCTQGVELSKERRYKEAISVISQAISLAPNYKEAYIYRGSAHLKSGEASKALTDFDRALELQYEPEALYWHGLAQYSKGNYKAALQDVGIAHKLNTGAETRLRLSLLSGNCFWAMKNLTEADRHYAQAISDGNGIKQFDNLVSVAYYLRGELAHAQRKWKLADDYYHEALSLKPSDSSYWRSRGRNSIRSREYNRAITYLTRAVRLNPKDKLTYFLQAQAYSRLGLADFEERSLKKLVSAQPRDGWGYAYRGLHFFTENRYAGARQDFAQAIKINSQIEPTLRSWIATYNKEYNKKIPISQLLTRK